MSKNKILLVAIIVSLLLSLLSDTLAITCGVLGFVILGFVQLSLFKQSGAWAIVGGKPTLKIKGKRRTVSLVAIGIIIGPLVSLLAKLAWLKYAL